MLYSFGTRPHAVRDVFKFDWTKGSPGLQTGSPYQACVKSLRIKQIQECKWQISRVCREHLGRFEVPKGFVRLAALPVTSTGKVQKFVLREGHLALYEEKT